MNIAFYLASAVAIAATAAVICGRNAIHALLSLIVSLLAVAVVFVTFGAPFVAALEVIVYAGAIMVLFVFVVVLLNVTPESLRRESAWLRPSNWIGPAVLGAILLVGLAIAIGGRSTSLAGQPVGPQAVGMSLFSTYLLGVELASLLLLAGLIGAYHLGHRSSPEEEKRERANIGGPTAGDTVPIEASPREAAAVAGNGARGGQEVSV
ncbi:MAG TPA: NADH-quinone oxidoreductase subunit J [Chloroflexota bacterium]|nr:NADH-quinone oxidoreductase subunit J [Chloroflexota bacterium]